MIETETSEECGLCVSVKSMGHPLTFVSVIGPIYLPRGNTEWYQSNFEDRSDRDLAIHQVCVGRYILLS